MKLPSPKDCGLPEKITKWRHNQEELINFLSTSTKRFKIACAPTGSGKSPAFVAAAILSGEPTCVVTHNNGLLEQYMQDFEEIGMVSLKGKRNYKCDMRNDYTCEEGQAARCPYKGTVACPSSQAEMRASTSNLVVTNYAKWCASKKYGTGMSHFTQVIFDECHTAFDALASALQIQLGFKEIEETLKIPLLTGEIAKDFSNWKPWAKAARTIAENALLMAQARLVGVSSPKAAWVKHVNHMKQLNKRLAFLSLANADEWIVDEIQTGFQFDPIRPGKYAEIALFMHIPKVIMGSATVRLKTGFMLGIGRDKMDFREFDSDFDPAKGPVYYTPTMRVDRHNTDLRLLWAKHDQIAAKRKDRNGLVHTISYARRDDIMVASRYADRMLFNAKGEPPAGLIDKFISEYPGAILVSPTMGTGYNFEGKACEWQFVTKIPFPDSRSKIVKARQELDKEYGPYVALQDLVQMAGRIVRSDKDQGETFIGDMNLDWFMPRYGHLAPKSFHRCFKRVGGVPEPPERLR